jgi:Pathogenicity locus
MRQRTMQINQKQILKELREIPGVGESIAQDFWNLGIRSIKDVAKKDPEKLYDQLCKQMGVKVDRCMLYVMKCAVYYAKGNRNPELLKWWNWKDSPAAQRKAR